MRALLAFALAAAATSGPAPADEVLTAVRTIRPGEIVGAADLSTTRSDVPGALALPEQAVGLAARRMLVPGRPIMPGDVAAPLLVKRNGHVAVVYQSGALTIRAEGRALSDGALGDEVRVMNLASRQTIVGTVAADGTIDVRGRK
jgi:flagellar basal body P-ring formation protein FlgA